MLRAWTWTIAILVGIAHLSGCSEGCNSPGDISEKDAGDLGLNSRAVGEEYLNLPVDEQLQRIAFDSQEAGYVAGNLEDYMNPWSNKGKSIAKRGPKDRRYGRTFDFNQLESSRRILFSSGGILADSLVHTNPVATVEGTKGTLVVDAELTYGSVKKVYKENYLFEKSSRGWEITEKSSWPTKTVKDGMETLYSKGSFVRLDTAASVAKKEGNVQEEADALEAAFRYNEAYKIRKEYIQTSKSLTASDWFKAAQSAIESGHITAAMRCYEKAFELDPSLPIPEGGLVMKQIRGDAEYTDDELRSMKVDTKGPDEYTPDTSGDEAEEGPSDGGSPEANPEADGGTNGDKKEAPKTEEAVTPEGAEKPVEAGTPEPSSEKPAP